MSAATGRDRILEKKIAILEQRLVIVERFVEMRFCESFRDFSIRSLPAKASLATDDQKQNVSRTGADYKKQKKTSVKASKPTTREEEDDYDVSEQEQFHNVSSPSSVQDVDEEEATKTSYRTRSGRKSTRISVLSKSSREKISKPSVSSSTVEEVANSRKVLRVEMRRIDQNSKIPDGSGAAAKEVKESPDMSIVKVDHDTEDDEPDDAGVEGGDDYFTFPCEGENADDGESAEEGEKNSTRDNSGVSQNDGVEPPYDDESNSSDEDASGDNDGSDDDDYKPKSNKRKSSANANNSPKQTPTAKKQRKNYGVTSRIALIPEGAQLQMLNATLKECPFCHKHWKPELFDMHVETHVRERHLKCSFCNHGFFTKGQLMKHEKIHQLDKYGVKCRLCEKIFLGNFKRLEHERNCIRKHLQAGTHVDPNVIEDVRERSANVDLRWPDSKEKLPRGMKKCVHCKRLIEESLLMGHLKEFHAQWKCSFCDNTFVLKSGLVRHLNRTHGNNRVTCNLCNKTFESKGSMRSHNEQCRRDHAKGRRAIETESQKLEEDTSNSVEQEQEVVIEEEVSLDSTCMETTQTDEHGDKSEIQERGDTTVA